MNLRGEYVSAEHLALALVAEGRASPATTSCKRCMPCYKNTGPILMASARPDNLDPVIARTLIAGEIAAGSTLRVELDGDEREVWPGPAVVGA